MTRAVVFAYHNVGVRCLRALLGRGVEIPLIVTHLDNPQEEIWFDSVRALARDYDIPAITPADPNSAEVLAAVQAARPDFLFSFYYRNMLGLPLLQSAARGAFNLHGSLLPRYRGRVPVNWAIIHGETETGATLHVMNEKPDNGAIVDQMAVPILPDDTAREVFDKVTVAAEMVLWRSLPGLIDGSAVLRAQDLSLGAYFGGRKPQDGRIDPQAGAGALHNFVRALTRPYPGAYAEPGGKRLVIWKTRLERADAPPEARQDAQDFACLRLIGENVAIETAGGGRLRVLAADLDGTPLTAENFAARLGDQAVALT